MVNSRRRRDQRGTEGRHAVLQDLFGHKGDAAADVLAGLREVDAVSTCRERTSPVPSAVTIYTTKSASYTECVKIVGRHEED